MMKITKVGNGIFASFEIANGAWFTCTNDSCKHTEFSRGQYRLKRANRCPVCNFGLFLSEFFLKTYTAWLEENEPTLTMMISDHHRYLDTLREKSFYIMLNAAVDWQYLTVKVGGMARKSDCDAWLMARYGIDECQARDITNTITSGPRHFITGNDGVSWIAARPESKEEDYPEIHCPK